MENSNPDTIIIAIIWISGLIFIYFFTKLKS